MNIVLWVLQVLLALHTALGAVWKFANSEQTVPSLSAIPHGAWLALIAIELLCAIGLIVPAFSRRLAALAPAAAAVIGAEMLLFSAVHLASGETDNSQMIYWLVVAAICAFIAYGRFVLKPLRQG
jgi:hypothetical protein